jgi:hypothetical protein
VVNATSSGLHRDKEGNRMPTFLRICLFAGVLPIFVGVGCQTGRWVHPDLTVDEAKARFATDSDYCSHEPVTTVMSNALYEYGSNEGKVKAKCLEKHGWRWSPEK